MFPWEKRSYYGKYYKRYYNPYLKSTYDYSYEYLDDTSRMKFRKGDIVLFDCGFYKILPLGWQSWFVKGKDIKKFWKKNKNVPIYARNELGVIIGRYRKVKYKYKTFCDYGIIIMMLTGSKVGHIRYYYGFNKPFKIKVKFPNKIKQKYIKKKLPQNIIDIFNENYDSSNKSRNLLAQRLYNNLKKG